MRPTSALALAALACGLALAAPPAPAADPAPGTVRPRVVPNHPPRLENLAVKPSRFVTTCEAATLSVAALDPDGDTVTVRWEVVSTPADATPRLELADGAATFRATTPGRYRLRVVAVDTHGAEAVLAFPVDVSAARCP